MTNTKEKRKQLMIAEIEKRREEKKHRRKRRRITASVTAAIMVFTLIFAVYSAGAKEITVTEINEFQGTSHSVKVKMRSGNVSDALEQTGCSVGETDKINKPIHAEIEDNDDIVVKRGKQITIKSEAGEQVVNITTANKEDALVEAGYLPNEFAEINTNGETLADSDTIEVVSLGTQKETTESETAFTTEYVEDDSLPRGETRVVSEGQNGIKAVTSKVTYKNGEEISREVIGEDIVTPVKNRVIAKGTADVKVAVSKSSSAAKSVSASTGGSSINGMQYTKKITMTATAYTTSPSENGGYSVSAMGNPLRHGIVAIDPSIVPLGSKVYVEAADGSWSYGVASAEDTGGAIKGNRIDLCFEMSPSKASNFGRQSCNVYILK